MSNPVDTNQASEDELQRELERLYKCVVYDLIDDVDRKELWIKEVGTVVEKLSAIERKNHELQARIEALDHIIDLQSKQFNRWTQKDIANFFNDVGKYYRELKVQQEEV